jgi:hypothetical protein
MHACWQASKPSWLGKTAEQAVFPFVVASRLMADRCTTTSASTGRQATRGFQQICKRLATKSGVTPEGYALIFLALCMRDMAPVDRLNFIRAVQAFLRREARKQRS